MMTQSWTRLLKVFVEWLAWEPMTRNQEEPEAVKHSPGKSLRVSKLDYSPKNKRRETVTWW